MSDHETIRDQAAMRASWDGDCPDVTRIVRRVGAALNSGRDAAVVDAVLDETQAARDEADTLRAEVERLRASHEVALRRLRQDGHPEDRIRFATLHIEAALAGNARPLALCEAEADTLRTQLAAVAAVVAQWESDRDVCLAWINDPAMHLDDNHPRRLSQVADWLDRHARSIRAALGES